MKKIISLIISLVTVLNIVAFSAIAEDNQHLSLDNDYEYNYYVSNTIGEETPEYLDIFNSVFQFNAKRLFIKELKQNYYVYAYEVRGNKDIFNCIIYVDSELEEFNESNFDNTKSDLIKIMNADENDINIAVSFLKNQKRGYLYYKLNAEFIYDNHDCNYRASRKLFDYLNEKYELGSTYITLDDRAIHAQQRIEWTKMYTIDEFGYKVSLFDELTEKQINNLNEEFKEKGYNVKIDTDTGYLSYDVEMTELQKLQFADYFHKEYGYTPLIGDEEYMPYGLYSNIKLNMFSSDVTGDVDNDDMVKINDLVLLNKWLLAPDEYLSFNSENADINQDGVIDVFDLIMLRRFFIEDEEF